MISLPIIFREFQTQARRKRTFVLRVAVGLLLGGAVSLFLIGYLLAPPSAALGRHLLTTFGWQIFILTFLGAPALTCDCISEERSEGTLPLLFLTHMNPADIILGKFIGKGFDGLMLFLAGMPFFFVPFLLGGVSFEMTAALVLNVLALLIMALAVGIFSSTISRTTTRAFVTAYAGLLMFNWLVIILPLATDIHLPIGDKGIEIAFPAWLRLASPVNGLWQMSSATPGDALITLAWSVAITVALLACSIWRLPRTLEETTFRRSAGQSVRQRVACSWLGRRLRRKLRLLHRNPIFWRAAGEDQTWLATGLLTVALWFGFLLLANAAGSFGMRVVESISILGWILIFAIKFLAIIHISRSVVAEKQTGSLELLLTTPLSNLQLVHGKLLSTITRYGLLLVAAYLAVLANPAYRQLENAIVISILACGIGIDLVCSVLVAMRIAVGRSKLSQAIGWSFGAVMFLNASGTVCAGFVLEPVIAIICYCDLVRNFRRYAATQ